MLGALIFDVDGTLAETEEAHRIAFNRAFADWGLGWNWSRETYRALLKTTGGKERIAAYQETLPEGATRLAGEVVARLHADKTALYKAMLASEGMALRPGIAALIAMARRAGLRLAVATTTSRPNVEVLCRAAWGSDAEEIFDVLACGDEVARKKPAPDVYALALQRLGLPAGACIAFEDSRNGLLAARAAGLRVFVTPSVYTGHEDLAGATWQAPDVSSAMRLLHDPVAG